MPNFDEFLAAFKEKLAPLVADLKRYKDAAAKDANSFIEDTRADLERWTRLVAQSELSADELRWLLSGRLELAKMVALKQAGLAKVRLDAFKKGLLEAVTSAALRVFGQRKGAGTRAGGSS
jgi:hypothetical protein